MVHDDDTRGPMRWFFRPEDEPRHAEAPDDHHIRDLILSLIDAHPNWGPRTIRDELDRRGNNVGLGIIRYFWENAKGRTGSDD